MILKFFDFRFFLKIFKIQNKTRKNSILFYFPQIFFLIFSTFVFEFWKFWEKIENRKKSKSFFSQKKSFCVSIFFLMINPYTVELESTPPPPLKSKYISLIVQPVQQLM